MNRMTKVPGQHRPQPVEHARRVRVRPDADIERPEPDQGIGPGDRQSDRLHDRQARIERP